LNLTPVRKARGSSHALSVTPHQSRFISHALAAAALLFAAASPAAAGEAVWTMLYEQSAAHLQRGDVAQAELFAREALREAETSLGQSRATELSLLRVAHILRLRGKPEEALPLAERAVKLSTRLHGAASPNTGLALQNQAEAQSAMKRYAAAEALHQKALAIFLKAYGEKHFVTAVSLHNIGAMLYAQDKNKEAEKYLRHALAVKEQVLKPGNLSIAHTLDQLSAVLVAQGRDIEAARYKKRADGIKQRAQPQKAGA
jgi:tetratricopeptide (TPR) repeat protein